MDMFNSTQMLSVSPKGGGGTGTSDYNELTGKPSINGVVLEGDKTLDSLNIQAKGDYPTNTNVDSKITSHNTNNASHSDIRGAIPTKTSQLTNDSNYATTSQLPDISVKVDKTTTVNGKPLSSNVIITQDDVASGANNKAFSNADKTKLDSIVIGSGGNINADITAHNADVNAHPSIRNMLTLDAQSKSNFDFIQNKVVQDGLVGNEFVPLSTSKSVPFVNGNEIDLIFTPLKTGWLLLGSSWGITINALDSTLKVLDINSGSTLYSSGIFVDVSKKVTISIYKSSSGVISIGCDSKRIIVDVSLPTQTSFNIRSSDKWGDISLLTYSKQLTPQEINHNFNVLNNSPSTNALTVTDANANKTTLLLASDTNHVEGRGGVLQDQINADFYKMYCKEFTSTDGSDITVANGWRGYVNSFLMTGQTVKNYVQNYTNTTNQEWVTNGAVSYLGNGIFRTTSIYQGRRVTGNVDFSKKYKLILNITKNGSSVPLSPIAGSVNTIFAGTPIPAGQTGVFVFSQKATLPTSKDYWFYFTTGGASEVVEYSFVIVEEGQEVYVKSWFECLGSTQASITSNGIKYNFYMQDGNVITLGGAGGVNDTLELKEDGSGIVTQNTKESVLNGSENWSINDTKTNTIAFNFVNPEIKHGSILPICDKFPSLGLEAMVNTDNENICVHNSSPLLRIRILKSKLSTQDAVGFKAYLSQNPITVRYQLATPIVTSIPKEKMACVLTSFNQNIILFGDAVKPASYVLTMPTSDMLKRDYTITLLNGYSAVAGSFNPRLSLRNDNKVELSLDLMSSATYNPTIMMLPVELRPKTDIKLNGFVDNISTPIIIKKTGEVQVPNSIISKNVYVKDTYRIF